MDKRVIAGVMLLSVGILMLVLYALSVVMHKIPERIALIVGALFAVPDTIIALFILTRPDKQ
jgi:hypothetical protein